jgi:acyl carrier protein
VREAVVTARQHRAGDVRLVAYLTAGGPAAPDSGELIDHLKQRLPEYMVPAHFVLLDELPLTPNGKVDRAALPEPAGVRPDAGPTFVGPRDEMEATIAGLWSEVLGVDRVGMHDNFFDLGGHSLLLAQVRTALAERTGRGVSMVELFQHPTVASLAGHLSGPADGSGPGPGAARERAEHRRRALHRRQQATNRQSRSHVDG